MRLHVLLAKAGYASRRAAERLVSEGRVRVNGQIIQKQGVRVNPRTDRIEVDGKGVRARFERKRYFIFHKPDGVVTTLKDRHAERTVADFFRDIPEKLVPAGRLDKHSTGLLLMTNDGDLIYRLTHPRYQVERSYRVLVKGNLSPELIRRLERGIILDEKRTAPCRVRVLSLSGDTQELMMTLHEGRKREIREMMKRIGSRAIKIHRESYGPIHLGNLKSGARRELSADEVAQLVNKT